MTIKQYLSKICTYSGLEKSQFVVEVTEETEKVYINLELAEEFAGYYIGFKGETLSALEYLLKIVFKEEFKEKRIILDINHYKKRREETLLEKVHELAKEVLETKEKRSIKNLTSYERFLIHSYISSQEDLQGIATFSEDSPTGRILHITLKEE